MSNEQWFPIKKVLGRYEISTLGRIKSVARKVKCAFGKERSVKERIRKVQINNMGYLFLLVKHEGGSACLFVHLEIGRAFIPNPLNKPEINHKDGNPLNNSLDNLEWATRSEQMIHSYRELNHPNYLRGLNGGEHPRSIKILATNLSNGEKKTFDSQKEAAKELGISKNHIYSVMNNKTNPTRGFSFKKIDKYAKAI